VVPMVVFVMILLLHSLFTNPTDHPVIPMPNTEEVHANGQPSQNHYVLTASEVVWVREHRIEMNLYALRDEGLVWQQGSTLAERVATVTTDSGGFVQWPMEGLSDEIDWYIPKTPELLLALRDANGGNCLNCSFLHIVSLADPTRPKVVGRVTDISDENRDGWDDLMTNDDLFEVFYFCHADSVSIRLFCQVEGDGLVPSVEPYRAYYEALLADVESWIQGFMALKTEDIQDGRDDYLWLILQEFLICRVVSSDMAWETFHKRLGVLNENTSYLIEAGILDRLSP